MDTLIDQDALHVTTATFNDDDNDEDNDDCLICRVFHGRVTDHI